MQTTIETRRNSPTAATAAAGSHDNPVASGEKTLAIPRDLHRRVKGFCGAQDLSIKKFSEVALQRLLAELQSPEALSRFRAELEGSRA